VLLAGSVLAAFVVDDDSDGIDVGQGTTSTTTTTAVATGETTSTPTTTATTAPPAAAPGNGSGMTAGGSGEMAGPGVIADTGGEALLAPGTALLTAAVLLRQRPRRLAHGPRSPRT
jgi:hypothetical protein